MLDISVVIPAYKARPFIEETVQSVLDQVGVTFDVSVAVQGPEDGTCALLEKIAANASCLKNYCTTGGGQSTGNSYQAKQRGKYIKLHSTR